jgi:DNA-binding transcriptional regulator GbsR (MarR family)
MEYEIAKQKYIQTWGALATQWGISRTMAQVHALLLISVEPLSTDEIMEELQISRGNTNMNVRALMDWGIVEKEYKKGERKEFFKAKKDIWELFKQITKERSKREILPALQTLEELKQVAGDNEKSNELRKVVTDLHQVTDKVNTLVHKMIKSDEHWFISKFTDLLK